MNEVLKGCIRKFVLVFFEDILVYNIAMEHQLHLWHVLQILETQALSANVKKCTSGQSSITYLNHFISAQGVAAKTSKIEVMLNRPLPCSLKELHGFLGLTGYCQHYVAHYGSIAWPLTKLLKKDNFH